MQNRSIYPVGTKVKIGDNQGVITAVKLQGSEYQIVYLTSYYLEGRLIEAWLFDLEFSTKSKKIIIGTKLI